MRMLAMRFCFAAVLFLLVPAAFAAHFPAEPWSRLSVLRDEAGVPFIADAEGRPVMTFMCSGTVEALSKLRLEIVGDHLRLDLREAAKGGLGKLVMNSCGLDPAAFAGREAVLKATFAAERWSRFDVYFEGRGRDNRHFYTSRRVELGNCKKTFTMIRSIPDDLKNLHMRFDILYFSDVPVDFYGAEYGLKGEIDVNLVAANKPRQLFHVPFDDTCDAQRAGGDSSPLKAERLEFAPGVRGRAVRLSSAAKSVLSYPVEGNLNPVRGTVSLWCRREWRGAPGESMRSLFGFSEPAGRSRRGTGMLWFWWWGSTLRGDVSDFADTYVCRKDVPFDGDWHHLAYAWDETGVALYVDGKSERELADDWSPLKEALNPADPLEFDRMDFHEFFIGCQGWSRQIDGLVDELRIFSEPLSRDEIRRLYLHEAGELEKPVPDYAKLLSPENHWETKSEALRPGVPERELIETIKLDRIPDVSRRFREIGGVRFGELNGIRYLEAGREAGSRWAVGFTVDTNTPLYSVEIDYPDDGVRTADFIIQRALRDSGDYAMQVGYATGGEYANTGKILTHRVLYWAAEPELALIAMTARTGEPAAASEIRVYRVNDSRLPLAGVKSYAKSEEWNRHVGVFFEDPAVGYDFGATRTHGHDLDELEMTIDRMAALMKFSGEDILLYPGSWYHGLIGRGYNPRNHADDFLTAWYCKFDREGLFLIPTINQMDMPVPTGMLSYEKMCDGSLHQSPVAILDTGRPNWGAWHGSPPNFNIFHKNVQEHILEEVDALIAQGRDHPSFKGVAFHLVTHNLLWWGDARSGYNDYAIEAFERSCHLRVAVDRKSPERGKQYAEWIRQHAFDKWIDWRCEILARFYGKVANRLKAARPDLKLVLTVFASNARSRLGFVEEDDAVARHNREGGVDMRKIARYADNVILQQTIVPADYRYFRRKDMPYAEAARMRALSVGEKTFADVAVASRPWLGIFDRYWESPVGAADGKNTLSCDWLHECGWRVSTINPSGRHALEAYVKPLRYCDVMTVTKGGFLIGTYGMEPELVSFARAFRALPAVKFRDLPAKDTIRLRAASFHGKTWFYLVNTEYDVAEVRLTVPRGTIDLVTGKAISGTVVLKLLPYELMSFCAPKGLPHM